MLPRIFDKRNQLDVWAYRDALRRIEDRSEPTADGHQLWIGATIKSGKARTERGVVSLGKKQQQAHRVLYDLRQLQRAQWDYDKAEPHLLPADRQLLRICDQPLCIAAEHHRPVSREVAGHYAAALADTR